MREQKENRVSGYLGRKRRNRKWHSFLTCLAAVVVFGTAYSLILPAITMTKEHPTLAAEVLEGWSGDELSVRVNAETETSGREKTFVLVARGEGADLSPSFVFDEEGVCTVTDEEGQEILLHRTVREDQPDAVDYWFTLPADTRTAFTLDLTDKTDPDRFAKTVKAVRDEFTGDGQENGEARATASDAQPREYEKATPSAASAATGSNARKASSSDADIREANAAAKSEEELIRTEVADDGHVEILDGLVVNDLEDQEEAVESTELTAFLKVSAGFGNDYAAAVRDAGRNADKRGDAELKFTWKDIAEKKAAEPDLSAVCNGAVIALYCDSDSGIPADASLSVRELEEGTDEYRVLAESAGSAVASAAEDGTEKQVSHARFFDITILDGEGNVIEPDSRVKVVITYDQAVTIEGDGELNVVHFPGNSENTAEVLATEVLIETGAEGSADVEGFSFMAESFSVYGLVYTVDFTYEDAGISIPGGTQMLLSQLLVMLDIDVDIAEVESVEFTDSHLVTVEKVSGQVQVNGQPADAGEGDFLLTSKEPFTSNEVLTIIKKDGTRIEIGVTDEQHHILYSEGAVLKADGSAAETFPADDKVYYVLAEVVSGEEGVHTRALRRLQAADGGNVFEKQEFADLTCTADDAVEFLIIRADGEITLAQAVSGTNCTRYSDRQLMGSYIPEIDYDSASHTVNVTLRENEIPAGNSHTVKIKFQNEDQETIAVPAGIDTSEKYYVLAYLTPKGTGSSGKPLAWALLTPDVQQMNAQGSWQGTVSANGFRICDADLNETGGRCGWNDDLYDISLRMYHSDKQCADMNEVRKNASDSAPKGYDFKGVYEEDENSSVIRLHKAYEKSYGGVRAYVDVPGLELSAEDHYIALVKLTHETSGVHYAAARLVVGASDGGEAPIGLAMIGDSQGHYWRDQNGNIVTSDVTFTGNEKGVEVTVITTGTSDPEGKINTLIQQPSRNWGEGCYPYYDADSVEGYTISIGRESEEDAAKREAVIYDVIRFTRDGSADTSVTKDEIDGYLENALNYGLYTENLASHGTDMESNIGAAEVTGDFGADWGYSDNNKRVNRIRVLKSYIGADGKPAANEDVSVTLYKNGSSVASKSGKTASDGTLELVFDQLEAGTYTISETVGGKTYRYTDSPAGDGVIVVPEKNMTIRFGDRDIVIDPAANQNVSFFGKIGPNVNLEQMIMKSRHSTIVVSDKESFDRLSEANAKVNPGQRAEIVLAGPDSGYDDIDISSDMDSLRELSRLLADASGSETVRVINTTKSSLDRQDGLNIKGDGRFVVVNIDMTGAGSEATVNIHTKYNGQYISADFGRSGSEYSSLMLYNFIVRDSEGNAHPYTGTINTANETGGVMLAPSATVANLGANFGGTIIAGITHHKGSEIHSETTNKIQNRNTLLTNSLAKDTGDLRLEKKLSDAQGDRTTWFLFTVKLFRTGEDGAELPVSGTYAASGLREGSTVTFDETGVARVQVRANNLVSISGIPAGTQYQVSEVETAESAAYQFESILPENGSGTVGSNVTASVTVTNRKKTDEPGSLKITKKVAVGGNEQDPELQNGIADGTYSFRVYGADGATLAKKADGTDIGVLTITVDKGVSSGVQVDGLVPGTYVVKETEGTNRRVSLDVSAHQVSVVSGRTAEAVVTNNIETTDIPVKKVWSFAEKSRVLRAASWPTGIKVVVELYSSVNGSEPVATGKILTLEAGKTSGTFAGLYKKDAEGNVISYSVREVEFQGDVTGFDPDNFITAVSGSETEGYTITNTEKGGLTVIKSFTGAELTDAEKAGITFTVTGEGLPESGLTRTYAEFEDGKWTLTGKDGIKPGKTYTVTEKNADIGNYVRVTKFRVNQGEESAPHTETEVSAEVLTDELHAEGSVVFTNDYTSETVEIGGTKTWKDGGRNHDNAKDLTLRLYRTAEPESESSEWKEVADAMPEWNGNSYKFTGLEKYVPAGESSADGAAQKEKALWVYKAVEEAVNVTEERADGSIVPVAYRRETDAENRNSFINTEVTEVLVSKAWKRADGSAAAPDKAEVTMRLYRENDLTTELGSLVLDGTPDSGDGQAMEYESWKGRWTGLDKYDESGNLITYVAREDAVSGYETVYDSENRQYVFSGGTVTNTELSGFSFTKEWQDQKGKGLDKWPEAREIEVRITRSTADAADGQFALKYKISAEALKSKDGIAAEADSVYPAGEFADGNVPKLVLRKGTTFTFDLNGLKKFSGDDTFAYYVDEISVLEYYDAPVYFDADGKEIPKGSALGGKAPEGGKILNRESAGVELPSTGGPGTLVYTICGAMLILGTAVSFLLRRMRRGF